MINIEKAIFYPEPYSGSKMAYAIGDPNDLPGGIGTKFVSKSNFYVTTDLFSPVVVAGGKVYAPKDPTVDPVWFNHLGILLTNPQSAYANVAAGANVLRVGPGSSAYLPKDAFKSFNTINAGDKITVDVDNAKTKYAAATTGQTYFAIVVKKDANGALLNFVTPGTIA